MKKLINKIIEEFSIKPTGVYTFINAYSFLKLKSFSAVDQLNGIYLDGILLVWLLRLFGYKINRFSFDMTSIAPTIFNYATVNNKSICFVGSTEENLNKATENIKKIFPKLNICSTHNGYFLNDLKMKEYICKLSNINPDIVIVGMGTPKQEKFLIELVNGGWKGVGYTCGGFYHQTAQKINYYPKIFDKFHIRWLYRIYKEPRLITRYIIMYPLGLVQFCFELIIKK
ncbi:MAG TPA: WecB/TagA/CpsF family glycosyltransferase [Chitinispirillaceae bacterium]|nr:WecB/TagA/CpsF family glycosyltransferase [Chitinispirillaceae bacterium]